MSGSVFTQNIKRDVSITHGMHLLVRHGGSYDDIYKRIDELSYPRNEVDEHIFCEDTPLSIRNRKIKVFDAWDGWSTDAIVKVMVSYIALANQYLHEIKKVKIIRVPQEKDGHFNDSFEFISSGEHLLATNIPNYSGAGSTANGGLRSVFMALAYLYDIRVEEVIRSKKLESA